MRLRPADGWVVPQSIVPDPIPLADLIAIALTQRPELAERQAAIRAAFLELRNAKLLPFSPNVILGYSAGTFGGGSNLASDGSQIQNGKPLFKPRFDSFAPREDFDAIVYWTARNLGVFSRNAIVEISASRSGPDPSSVDIVFEGDRNSMQGAAEPTRPLLRIKVACLRKRLLAHDRYESIEFGIVGFDSGKTSISELGGRDGARPNAA